MTPAKTMVIIGAGLAGAKPAAEGARAGGFRRARGAAGRRHICRTNGCRCPKPSCGEAEPASANVRTKGVYNERAVELLSGRPSISSTHSAPRPSPSLKTR